VVQRGVAATGSNSSPRAPGLLHDTAARDYSRKLRLFNAFAAPELRQAIASLSLKPGMSVLDAGCGTGEALHWLAASVQPAGRVIGLDLAAAHVAAASGSAPPDTLVLQADLRQLPLQTGSFDLIWCVNTVHHLPDPSAAIRAWRAHLRPGGRIAIGQSSVLPEMFFAWDQRLERLTNEAVRRYYRERYRVREEDLTGIRGVLSLLRRAGLQNVTARTFLIERLAPLSAADRLYLEEAIFRDTWGERLRPYLESEDFATLTRLCDPGHPEFALHREDFHFLQTFTVFEGAAESPPAAHPTRPA
jgi:SAM-dependent methyltransferase